MHKYYLENEKEIKGGNLCSKFTIIEIYIKFEEIINPLNPKIIIYKIYKDNGTLEMKQTNIQFIIEKFGKILFDIVENFA